MKKLVSFFIKLLVSALLVVLAVKFTNLDIGKTIEQVKNSDTIWFVVSCLFVTGTIMTNTYRWMILANLLDYKLTYPKALRMYFESAFSNNFLPSNFGGDAIRAFDLGRQDKTWLRAASTIVMERLFGFTLMFALMPVGIVLLKFSPWQGAMPSKIEILLWLGFGAMIAGLLSYPLWSKIPWHFIQKVKYAVQEYTKCKKSLLKVLLWTFITHACLIGGNVAASLAMGVSFDQIPLWYWFIVVPTSTLLSFVIPAVKGVGAKEASYIYLLSFIDVDSSTAFAIAFLVFVATLISTLPGISIAFRKIKPGEKVKLEHEQEEESLVILERNNRHSGA